MPIHALLNDANIVTETSPPTLPGNIQAFRLACFEFQLCLSEGTKLPVFKGAVFHGALGQALARIGTHFRDYFYNPSPPSHWSDTQQAPPRPYILIPPLDNKSSYAAGDTLSLGIVLYGSAIDYFLIVFAALEHLGEFMGLGKQRGRFQIDRIQQLTADGTTLLYQNRQWLRQTEAWSPGSFLQKRLCPRHVFA